ncbi:hypothetical protein G6O69_04770 [Pseudenhygromyxa sp. WMMC2535]|uniref:hypothetical protein n=1 Tax=Pseudenhygromyxa sp. WMMC2535 TaxID=2712867 RepID=UPI001596344E|nr:hypothetical protein [Pseudenhygromyxa sp. WMMC2535]NVB37132.1 hypothetical protein [Pseudenhygromyxa sp. WMMC2535]
MNRPRHFETTPEHPDETMPDTTLPCTDASDRSLRPARALLTPTWVGALALLVANDHWLKGSGLLPGELTGKLSDFAGMLVAPVLLATLLRVQTRRGLLACHLAVAAVFTGIQLSPAFAGQWSALMGLLGHPWAITCDPTDLIALPALVLAWRLLAPEMSGERPALVPLQRTAVAGLSVFGLWSTVATSDIDSGIDSDSEWYQDITGNLYINNANDFDISLFIRPLRADLQLDCTAIEADPGRLLPDAAFDTAEVWSLPPQTNVGVDLDFHGSCAAALVSGEGIPPQILFFTSAEYTQTWFSGQTFSTEDLGRAGMAIVFDEAGADWVGGESVRFTPRDDAPEQPESCEADGDESRLDWSSAPFSTAGLRIESLESGLDGCYALELQALELLDNEVLELGVPSTWYMCVPAAAMPFVQDDVIRISDNTFSATDAQLSIELLDSGDLSPAVDDEGEAVLTVHYLRGGQPSNLGNALGRNVVAVDKTTCPFLVEDGCATVERGVDLVVNGNQDFVEVGVPMSFAEEASNTNTTAILAYARARALLDYACSEGADQLSYDIDMAVIVEPL